MSRANRYIEKLFGGPTMLVSPVGLNRSHTDHDGPLVKIGFDFNDEDDWPPVKTEWLWAIRLTEFTYKLDNIPFFVRECSYADIVTANADPNRSGALIFDSVVERGGHSTYRLMLEDEDSYNAVSKAELKTNLAKLVDIGCEFEMGDYNLIAVDVKPGIALIDVYELIRTGFAAKLWDWEAGFL